MRATQSLPFILNMACIQVQGCRMLQLHSTLSDWGERRPPKPPPIHATPHCQPQPQASLTATTTAVGGACSLTHALFLLIMPFLRNQVLSVKPLSICNLIKELRFVFHADACTPCSFHHTPFNIRIPHRDSSATFFRLGPRHINQDQGSTCFDAHPSRYLWTRSLFGLYRPTKPP